MTYQYIGNNSEMKNAKPELYGARDTPRVRITTLDKNGVELGQFISNDLAFFYEEFSTTIPSRAKMVEIIFTLFSPMFINILTNPEVRKFKLETEEIWRSVETNEDMDFSGPARYYTDMDLTYSREGEEHDPVRWSLNLFNKEED